jgi:hypothetical protein
VTKPPRRPVCDNCGEPIKGNVDKTRRVICHECTQRRVEEVEKKERQEEQTRKLARKLPPKQPQGEAISPDSSNTEVVENKDNMTWTDFARRVVAGLRKRTFFDFCNYNKIKEFRAMENALKRGSRKTKSEISGNEEKDDASNDR